MFRDKVFLLWPGSFCQAGEKVLGPFLVPDPTLARPGNVLRRLFRRHLPLLNEADEISYAILCDQSVTAHRDERKLIAGWQLLGLPSERAETVEIRMLLEAGLAA